MAYSGSLDVDYLIEYSMIFSDNLPEIENLLQGISQSTLLKTASFFLGFANKGSKYASAKDFLEMFF